MSATTTPPAPQPAPSAAAAIAMWGPVVVSILAELVFLVAMVITKLQGDAETFKYLVIAAATNATGVVNYWIGSSAGSAKKTDLMAANPPPAPAVTDPAATVTRTTSTSQTVAPVVTPIPTPAPTPGPLTP